MTKTEKALIEQLTQSTGRALCDSGDVYGRHWEKNQGRDFLSEPHTVLEFTSFLCVDGTTSNNIDITHNVFHFLNERLDYDGDMNRKFSNFARRKEYEDDCWLTIMEEFVKTRGDEIDKLEVNTYNGEDLLSQTIQYTQWYDRDNFTEYVLLQTHNGCDVRGGYSRPKVYRACDGLYDNARAMIYCPKCKALWESDEGYYWCPNSEYMDYADEPWMLFRDSELGDRDSINLLNISPNIPSWSKSGTNGERYTWVKCEEFPTEPEKGMFYVNEEGQGLCPYCGKGILEGSCR